MARATEEKERWRRRQSYVSSVSRIPVFYRHRNRQRPTVLATAADALELAVENGVFLIDHGVGARRLRRLGATGAQAAAGPLLLVWRASGGLRGAGAVGAARRCAALRKRRHRRGCHRHRGAQNNGRYSGHWRISVYDPTGARTVSS